MEIIDLTNLEDKTISQVLKIIKQPSCDYIIVSNNEYPDNVMCKSELKDIIDDHIELGLNYIITKKKFGLIIP